MIKVFLSSLFLFMGFFAFSQNKTEDLDWANLKKYSSANEAVQSRQQKPLAVLMGNSITEGWFYQDSSFFETNNLTGRGISGQTTGQMILRMRADVIQLHPKAVVLLCGINDIAQNSGPISVPDIFGNIVSMVELAKANKIKPVICSVLPANKFPWRMEIYPADKVIALNQLLAAYCKKKKILYVDYYKEMVDAEKGLDVAYTNDAVHPTLAGYKVMESILLRTLKKIK